MLDFLYRILSFLFGLFNFDVTYAPVKEEVDPILSNDEVIDRILKTANHYEVFGLSSYQAFEVSDLTIRYKKISLQVHPDKVLYPHCMTLICEISPLRIQTLLSSQQRPSKYLTTPTRRLKILTENSNMMRC